MLLRNTCSCWLRPASLSITLVSLISAFAAASLQAQEASQADRAGDSTVPIKRVVLFNSGVGYIEHGGTVEGDASVDLKFNVNDINDLLKSMVLQDLDGGKISTVTYGSRDPITRTLQTFAIDLTQQPTLSQLLNQIRGEVVELDAPTKVEGTIVGVETRKRQLGDDQVVEVEYLNVLTDEGLRRIALDTVGRIKLKNENLDEELRQALGVLARGHATDKKTVTLKFLGEGERDVRVGYIREAPVWKTSYRLVLDDEGQPFLQGWAIVENTTDTDWENVQLSLVSGRPISFVMDLYSPLYAARPTVVPELFASLRPQLYEQDLGDRFREFERAAKSKDVVELYSEKAVGRMMGRGQPSSEAAGVAGAPLAPASVPADGSAATAGDAVEHLGRSVSSAADAGDVGELFHYDIKTPVTLARQRSAMLPIINDNVEGKKVSIYNATVHAKHPLNGIELKNSSELHLMQGPVTVFDGGVYAGDARIPDLPPSSERLLSYALDLDVEVAPRTEQPPQDLLSVRVERGVLIATHKQTRTHKYEIKNSGDKEKRVLVEYPIETAWELVSPKEPAEKTRDMYRFAVAAEPGKTAKLEVAEQNNVRQDIALQNIDAGAIKFFLSAKVVPETVKDALREVARRQAAIGDLQRQHGQLQQEIATIGQEQQRIRENMNSIDRNTDLYNRYVKKFTDQEDRIETIREESKKLEAALNEARKSLDDYLSKLTLE